VTDYLAVPEPALIVVPSLPAVPVPALTVVLMLSFVPAVPALPSTCVALPAIPVPTIYCILRSLLISVYVCMISRTLSLCTLYIII